METKFNSQICTTREQSERLLSLGLKKDTADMTWEFSHTKNGIPQYDCRAESSWDSETFARYVEHCEKIGYFEHWKHEDGSQMTPEEVYAEIMEPHIPAWSLHRLIEMMPYSVEVNNKTWTLQVSKGYARYGMVGTEKAYVGFIQRPNTYDAIIDCIEWLIKEGEFEKEYLV